MPKHFSSVNFAEKRSPVSSWGRPQPVGGDDNWAPGGVVSKIQFHLWLPFVSAQDKRRTAA